MVNYTDHTRGSPIKGMWSLTKKKKKENISNQSQIRLDCSADKNGDEELRIQTTIQTLEQICD